MTDRIPLDHLTSDQYDALHARIADLKALLTEAEEHNETTCEAVTRAERAEAQLDALRQVARGYCPACGRGDAAPTVTDWEQQKQRADRAEDFARRALAQRQEMAAERHAWQERGDRAEAALARVQALANEYPAGIDTALIHAALDQTREH